MNDIVVKRENTSVESQQRNTLHQQCRNYNTYIRVLIKLIYHTLKVFSHQHIVIHHNDIFIFSG